MKLMLMCRSGDLGKDEDGTLCGLVMGEAIRVTSTDYSHNTVSLGGLPSRYRKIKRLNARGVQ